MQLLVPYILSIVLVGIPGAGGAYMVIRYFGKPAFSTGAYLLAYAILLAVAFAYLLPVGKLSNAGYSIRMPAVLISFLVIGAVAGVVKRRSDSRK